MLFKIKGKKENHFKEKKKALNKADEETSAVHT